MDKIIIDPGVIPVENVKASLNKSHYEVFFIGETFNCDIWKKNGIDSVPYQSFIEERPLKHKDFVSESYNDYFNAIFNNGQTPQLYERSIYQKAPWNNYFNGLMLISNLITNYMDYIYDINPRFMFYHSTPHNIFSWVFGKVCELMGVPVYISKTTPMPWRSYLIKGIDEYEVIPIKNNFNDTLMIDEYIRVNSSDFQKAISPYEKKGLAARKGKIWSWKAELKYAMQADSLAKKILLRPAVSIFRKYPLGKYYQSLSSNDYNGKYVVVFLHYQPERTSLPEGFNYTQQLHLIRTLRLGLPKDVSILVKEHPAIFVGRFDMRYRIKQFYKYVSEMENTRLLDITSDSFSVLDKAMAVATLTGTAGAQALIRGIPVLAFGKAPYLGAPDCYLIHKSSDVKDAIRKIETTTKEGVNKRTIDYFHDISRISTTGVDNEKANDFYTLQYHLNASSLVFDQLLSNEELTQTRVRTME